MWIFFEKRPFFRADMARLENYSMGGFGRIGVHRVNTKKTETPVYELLATSLVGTGFKS